MTQGVSPSPSHSGNQQRKSLSPETPRVLPPHRRAVQVEWNMQAPRRQFKCTFPVVLGHLSCWGYTRNQARPLSHRVCLPMGLSKKKNHTSDPDQGLARHLHCRVSAVGPLKAILVLPRTTASHVNYFDSPVAHWHDSRSECSL